MDVWLVWHMKSHDTQLIAACVDRATAMRVVEERAKWIEDYHGPHYPVEWQDIGLWPEMWGDKELAAKSQYGERLFVEQVPVRASVAIHASA